MLTHSILLAAGLLVSTCLSASCPEGWSLYARRRKCLKHFANHMKYRDAQASCRENEASLVHLADKRKTNFVKGLAVTPNREVYIGIRDDQRNGVWRYQDGTPLRGLNNWSGRAPNGYAGFKCVMMQTNGKWRNVHCNMLKAYVCEKDLKPGVCSGSQCQEGGSVPECCKNRVCPQGWTMYRREDKCIKAFQEKKTWDDARKTCKNENGDLVEVFGDYKAEIVDELMNDKEDYMAYIGLRDFKKNGKWTFVGGHKLTSGWWRHSDPEPDAHCGVQSSYILPRFIVFRSLPCSDKQNFICERPTIKS